MNSDDLLSAEEAAELLGCSVDAINARRWRLPCEVKLKDRSVQIRRRDLVAWREALDAERVERREAPQPTREQREVMGRMSAAQRQYGEPSRFQ
ncbi:MAG: helix-turn-helix domain-containing protein [Actinomycetota bacterium]|nr:helix-turn-helix domain-containing protein [Actinomycetota bacterium]